MLKERKGHKGPDGVKGRGDTNVSLVRNRSAWSRWSVVADFLHVICHHFLANIQNQVNMLRFFFFKEEKC